VSKLEVHKAKLAMAVRSKNAHWKLNEIKARHWDAVTRAAGLGDATPWLREIVTQTPRVLEIVAQEIPASFPTIVRDKIFDGLRGKVKEVAADL